MVNNRIEEVKMKLDNEARKVIFDALYRNPPYNQGIIADEVLDGLEKLGYRFPQPLDDEELREKIKGLIASKFTKPDAKRGNIHPVLYFPSEWDELADQILALLQQKIEEARKQERERIIAWGVEPCPHWAMYPDIKVIKRDCSQCWQALKGEKG